MYRWYQAVDVDGSMREFSPGGGDGRGMDYRAVCKEGLWPAHRGVLTLDELPEFGHRVLEMMHLRR